jgi:hypothetical protein
LGLYRNSFWKRNNNIRKLMKNILLAFLFPLAAFAQQQTIETTDNLNQGRVKMNANFTDMYSTTLRKGTSPSNGIYPTNSLYQVPGLFNQDVPPIEFFHYGKFGSPAGVELDRTQLPKGFVAFGLSMNIVNNWQWDNVQERAEPYDTDFPMITIENGGEGVLTHYTIPGGMPSTHFHEITRFGGGVDGLSGVNPLTTYIPFNQFKTTIYAQWRASTTISPATTEAWWGGTDNALGGVINPLLWLNTEETKGSGYSLNELARFSAYSTGVDARINFEVSGGSFQTKTAVATNSTTGRIGSNVYDGNSFENTAAIDFLTRGTVSDGNIGQSIRLSTSATNTAGLTTRIEVTNDGLLKTFIPWQTDHAGITIPSYSAVGYSPALSTTTALRSSALSTTTGGWAMQAFTSTSGTASAVLIRGVQGSTSPTVANTIFTATKHNGTTNFTDIGATEIGFHFRNNATNLIEILGSGRAGFGVTTPTANIHIKAGTATGSTAPLKIAEGTNLTTPEDGAIEHSSDNLNFTAGSTRYILAKTLTNTAALDFGSIASLASETLTITVTGAALGDGITPGIPNGSHTAGLVFTMWVSATNTVSVQCYNSTLGAIDPASGTFRASVLKY